MGTVSCLLFMVLLMVSFQDGVAQVVLLSQERRVWAECEVNCCLSGECEYLSAVVEYSVPDFRDVRIGADATLVCRAWPSGMGYNVPAVSGLTSSLSSTSILGVGEVLGFPISPFPIGCGSIMRVTFSVMETCRFKLIGSVHVFLFTDSTRVRANIALVGEETAISLASDYSGQEQSLNKTGLLAPGVYEASAVAELEGDGRAYYLLDLQLGEVAVNGTSWGAVKELYR